MKGAASALFSGLKSIYSTEFNFLNSLTGGKLGEIKDKFTDLASEAISWGSDMIENFRDGIISGVSAVLSEVREMAESIKDYIGFSEPDKGPLSNFHTYAPDMMKLYAQGIRQNIGMVEDAAAQAAGAIGMGVNSNTYTNNVGGVSIVVNAAPGQSVDELADVIEQRINRGVMMSARAMA